MIQVVIFFVFVLLLFIFVIGVQWAKIQHLERVIAWCDEREDRIKPLFTALDALRKSRLPVGGLKGMNEMFIGNIPSKPAVEQAGRLLQDMKEQNDALRKVFGVATTEAKNAVEGLIEWEGHNPVPVKTFPF